MSKPVTEDLFSFSGRRNRKSYILAGLLMFAVLCAIWIIAGILTYSSDTSIPTILAGLLSLPAAVIGWALGSQRCRDFGWTGWSMLLTLVPFVGGIFAIAIMFVPGSQGFNRYGPDPLGLISDTAGPGLASA